VTQAVGACDVELSNHVWRRPPRAHGIVVCCCIAGTHIRSAGSSTKPQKLGLDDGRAVGECCVQLVVPGQWVTLATRPCCGMQRAACNIASPQRVWKREGIWAEWAGMGGVETPHYHYTKGQPEPVTPQQHTLDAAECQQGVATIRSGADMTVEQASVPGYL
jgi:hypothetical protein